MRGENYNQPPDYNQDILKLFTNMYKIIITVNENDLFNWNQDFHKLIIKIQYYKFSC